MMGTTTMTGRGGARRALSALVVAAVALVLTGCLSADQTSDMDLVNAARKSQRKTTLSVNMAAANKAQAWSEHMAATGVLEHTGGGSRVDPSGLTGWCGIGENVGMGPSITGVHDAFMQSSLHKANILGNWKTMGTGVVKKGRTYWVTEIYIRPC